MEDNKQKSPKTKKVINIVDAFRAGSTLGDIYQTSKYYGVPDVILDDFDTFSEKEKALKPDITDDQLRQEYDYFNYQLNKYQIRDFDYNIVNGRYNRGMALNHSKDDAQPWQGKDDSFIISGPSNYLTLPGVKKPVMLEHQDQIAKRNGFFIDKNGFNRKLSDKDKYDFNNLENKWNKYYNTFVFQEIPDGQLADNPDNVLSPDWLGGFKSLHSNLFGSIATGLESGGVSKTVNAGAAALRLLNGVTSAIAMLSPDNIESGKTYNEIYTSSWLNKRANEISNEAAALSRKNYDESQGAFDNWSSVLFNIADGMGQMIPMIASGYAYGLVGLGETASVQLSILTGSATVYDLTHTDLIRKGYSPKEAMGIGLLYAAFTQVSENIFQSQLIERMGYQAARKKMTEVAITTQARSLNELVGEAGAKGVSLGKTGLEDVENTVIRNMPSKSIFANKFTQGLRKRYYEIINADNLGGKAAKTFAAGVEEGVEEVFENAGQNQLVARLFNASKKAYAENNLKQLGDVHYSIKPINGQYSKYDKNNNFLGTISIHDKEVNDAIRKRSEDIVNGTSALDTSFGWDDPFIAFISSALTMGFSHGISAFTNTQKENIKKATFNISQQYINNPAKVEASIIGNFDEMVSRKALDKGLAEKLKVSYMDNVRYYADLIKRFGLDKPELIQAVGDKSLLYELFQAMHANKNIQEALDYINNNDMKVKDNVEQAKILLGKVPNVEIEEDIEKTKKALTEKQADYEEAIKALSTPKVLKNKEITSTTSQRFTEKMNNVFAAKKLIKLQAEANIIKNLQKNSDWKYGDPLPVEQVKAEEKRLLKDYSFIQKALLETNTNEIWGLMTRAIDELTPKGMQEVIAKHNIEASKNTGDEQQLKSFLEEMRALATKEFTLPEETTTKKTEGKETTEQLFPAFKGNMEETIKEIVNRAGLNKTTEYLDSGVRNALLRYDELQQKFFGEAKTMNYSDDMLNLFKDNLDVGSYLHNLRLDVLDKNMKSEDNPYDVKSQEVNDLIEKLNIDEESSPYGVALELSKQKEAPLQEINDKHPDVPSIAFNKYFSSMSPNLPESLNNALKNALNEARPQTMALLNGLLHDGEVGEGKMSFFDLIKTLQETIGDPNAQLSDQNNTIKQIASAINLLNRIKETWAYLDDMSSQYIENLKPNEGLEHSIYQQKGTKITPQESKAVKNIFNALSNTLDTWSIDLRLTDVMNERESVKIKIGHLNTQYVVLRALIKDLSSKPEFDSKENTTQYKNLDKYLNTISDKVRAIIAIKDKERSEKLTNEDAAPELLYSIYHNAKAGTEEGDADIENIEQAIVDISNILYDIEEMFLSGKLKKVIDYIRETSSTVDKAVGQQESYLSKEPIFTASTEEYDGQISKANLEQGHRDLIKYQDAVLAAKMAGKKAPSSSMVFGVGDEAHARRMNMETFRFIYYQQLVVSNQLGQNGVPTRREMLAPVMNFLISTTGTKENVLTFEQLDTIVDILTFLKAEDNSPWEKNASPLFSIKNSLFVRGFAGTGKSQVVSYQGMLFNALLENRTLNGTYVMLTEALADIHKKQVEAINEMLEKIGSKAKIKASFIYANNVNISNVETKEAFQKADFIIYEEGSTLENPNPKAAADPSRHTPTGSLLNELQKKFNKKLIFLGDEAQVRSLRANLRIPSIGRTGNKTNPLVQVHRTDISVLRLLQETLRKALISFSHWTNVEMPEVKYKITDEGSIGARYIDEGNDLKSIDKVVEHFIDAKKRFPEQKILLLVPSYINKDELLAHYGEDFAKEYKSSIHVMAYDSETINEDIAKGGEKGYFYDNISGLDAEKVYVPFSLHTMNNPDANNIFSKVHSNNLSFDSITMLLTAVSRGVKYVELIGDAEKSQDVEDGVISGYKTDATTEQDKLLQKELERVKMLTYLQGIRVKPLEFNKEDTVEITEDINKGDDFANMASDMMFNEDVKDAHEREKADKALELIKQQSKESKKEHTKENKEDVNEVDDTMRKEFQLAETETNEVKKKYKSQRAARASILREALAMIYSNTEEERAQAAERFNNETSSYLTKHKKGDVKKVTDGVVEKFEKDESETNYRNRLKGYRARMLRIADMVADTMHLNKDEYSLYRPSIKATIAGKKWYGEPMVVRVIGYKENNGEIIPIIDIYSMAYTSKKLESPVDDAKVHMYRILAEQHGYIVRNSKLVKVVDDINEGEIDVTGMGGVSYGIDTGLTKSYKEILGVAGLDTDINLDKMQKQLNKDLFRKARKIYDYQSNTGRMYHNGDSIIDGRGNKLWIEDLFVLKGKVKALMSNGKIRTLKWLEDNYDNKTTGLQQINVKSSAVMYSHQQIRITSMIVEEAHKGLVDESNLFDRSKNRHFDIKLRILQALNKLKEEKLTRTFKSEYTAYPYTINGLGEKDSAGVVMPTSYKDVFVISMDEKQAAKVEKKVNESLKIDGQPLLEKGELYANGYDVIGIQLEAEYTQPTWGAEVTDFSGNKVSSNKALNDLKEGDYNEIKSKAEKIIREGFDNRNKDNQNAISEEDLDRIVKMNVDKFMEVWNNKYNNGEEITNVYAGSLGAMAMPSRDRYKTFDEVVNRMNLDGWVTTKKVIDGTIEADINRKNKKIESIQIEFTNLLTGDKVKLDFHSQALYDENNKSKAETVKSYLDDLLKNFKKEKSSIDKLLDDLDKEYAKFEFKSPMVQELKRRLKEKIFTNSEFVQFLNANKENFVELIEGNKYNDNTRLSHLFRITKTGNKKIIKLSGESYREIVENMGVYVNELKNAIDNYDLDKKKFYKPIIIFAGGNFDRLRVANISSPSMGVMQGVAYTSLPIAINKETTNTTTDTTEATNSIPDAVEPEGTFLKIADDHNPDHDLISREDALRQVISLIGKGNAQKYLGFNDGMILLQGRRSWGIVHNGLMTLADIGGIEATTPRHEALHFVIEYLMGDTQRDKLMNAARKQMGGKPSYNDVHEYLADMFEYEKYTPNTVIGRFLQAIKTFLHKYIGMYQNDIKTVLQGINDGFYADNEKIVKSGHITLFNESDENIDNEYNSDEVYRAKIEKFGSLENIDYWAEKNLNPLVFGYSGMGKTFITKANAQAGGSTMIGVNSYQDAVSYTWSTIGRLHNHYKNKYKNGIPFYNGKDMMLNTYGSIPREHYIAIIKIQKEQKRNKLSGIKGEYHFKENEAFLNAYVIQELKKKKSKTNNVSGYNIFINLIQKTFPNIDMSHKGYNGAPVLSSKGEIFSDRLQQSPTKNINSFIMAKFNSTRLRKYNESNGIVTDGLYGNRYMNGYLVFNEILNAADRLVEDGIKVNIKTLFEALQEKRDKLVKGNLKDNLHTFLVEYGPEVAMIHKNNSAKQIAYKSGGVGNLESFLSELTGVGYYYIEQHLKRDTDFSKSEMRKYIPKGYEDQIIEKLEEISKISAMIEDAAKGHISMRNTSIEFNEGNTVIRQLNNNNATIYRDTLRNQMRAKFNTTTNGMIIPTVWKDFLEGDKQLFKVTKDSLSIKMSDGNFITLIKKEGGKYVKQDVNIGYYKKALRYILNSNDLNNAVTSKIMEDSTAPSSLLTMFQKLYSAVINSRDFKETNKVKEDKTVWTKSEEAKMYDNLLGAYDTDQFKDRNPLKLYSPVDEYAFIRDVVATTISDTMTRSNDSMQIMADGTSRQTREVASKFYEDLSADSIDSGALRVLQERNKEDVTEIAKTLKKGEKKETPFVTIEKGKEPIWRDPINNKTVKISPLGYMSSISNGFNVIMDKDMSSYEVIRAYRELLRENIAKNSSSYYTFVEGTGGRTRLPITRISYGKDRNMFNITSGKNNGYIKNLTIDPVVFVNVVKDFVESDRKMRKLAVQRWEKVTGRGVNKGITIIDKDGNLTKEAKELQESDLIEHSEYKRKGNEYVIGNNYSSEDSPYKMTNKEYEEWTKLSNKFKSNDIETSVNAAKAMADIIMDMHKDRITTLEIRLLELANIDDKSYEIAGDRLTIEFTDKIGNEIQEALKVLSSLGDKNSFKDIITLIEEKKGKRISRLDALNILDEFRSIYNKLKVDAIENKEEDKFKADGIKEARETVFNKILPRKLKVATDTYYMAQLMYWNHHIFNRTFNNNIRGGVENFNGITDYQKRGRSSDAVGSRISERYIGKKLRTLTINDLPIYNKIFSEFNDKTNEFEKTDSTDGLVVLNAVLHRLIYNAKSAEYGSIGTGGLKTIYSAYFPTRNQSKIVKMSMLAPRYDKYSDPLWRSMMDTMYGKIWDKNIKDENTYSKWVNDTAIKVKQEIDRDGYSDTLNSMISYITFKSTVKDGAIKIHSLEQNENQDWVLPSGLNTENNTELVDSQGLRVQLSTGNFKWNNWKSIPSQIMYTVGVGEHNRANVTILNKILSKIVNLGVKKYTEVLNGNTEGFLHELGIKAIRNSNESVKTGNLINNPKISVDTWAGKATSVFLSDINKHFRPTLPGASVVQYPYHANVFRDNEGRVYTIGNEPRGLGKTKLRPIMWWKKEEGSFIPYTNRDELLQDSNSDKDIFITPQEVIMPFVHKDSFGIDINTTLAALTNVITTVGPLDMRTSLFQKEHDTAEEITMKLQGYLRGMSFEEITKAFHSDATNFFIKKLGKDFNNLKEDDKIIRFLNEAGKYFNELNNALDVFTVRIPTTGAASGFPSRIVEFSNNYDNTIFLSPDKNILDGSDYDIDELHIFHKPLLGKVPIDKNTGKPVVENKELFDDRVAMYNVISDYYYNPKNIEAILDRITTKDITKAADNADITSKTKYSTDFLSAMELRDISIAGEKLVGHYANLQRAISMMLHLSDNDIKNIFQADTAINKIQSFKDTIDLIGRISQMINAATDNDSLGGALGKIGFTEYTSQVISGMILAGKSLDDIIKVTTDDMIVGMEDSYKKRKFSGFASKSILKGLIAKLDSANKDYDNAVKKVNKDKIDSEKRKSDDKKTTARRIEIEKEHENNVDVIKKRIDYINELINYAVAGDKIFRFNSIIGLQQGIKGTSWGLYSAKTNVESALGQSLEDFLAGEEPTVKQQIEYIGKEKMSDKEMLKNKEIESMIRNPKNSFDLRALVKAIPQLKSYIHLLDVSYKIYTKTFSSTLESPLAKSIMDKLDVKTFFGENAYKEMLNMLDKVHISAFISEKYKYVDMNGAHYNLNNPKHRQDFVIAFEDFIKNLRATTHGNTFLDSNNSNSLRKTQTWGDIPIYNINASQGASKEILANLKEGGFDMFTPEEQQIFRIYNGIVYGFSRKDGNMSGAIDEKFEEDYSNWKETTKDMTGGVDPVEIIVRAPKIINRYGDKYYSFIKNGILQFGIKQGNDNYVPASVPYSSLINTLSSVKTYDYKNTFRRLMLDEIKTLKEGKEVVFDVPKHFVDKSKRAVKDGKVAPITKKENVGVIHNEDEVFLQDGSTAKIRYISKRTLGITLLSKAEEVKRETPSQTHIAKEARSITSRQAIALVDMMYRKIKILFPGVKVSFVDNESTPFEGVASWIEDGVVFINGDLITPETPVHEIRHLYLAFIRNTSIEDYNALKKAVQALLSKGDTFALQVFKDHSYLGEQAALEEVMVHYMNIKDQEDLIKNYERTDIKTGKVDAISAWQSLKDIISRAWNNLMSTIRDAMGFKPTVNMAHRTLKEFAEKSLKAINSNDVISNMTSSDLNALMFSVVTHKPRSISNVSQLFDWIFIKEGDSTLKDSQYNEQLLDSYNKIIQNGGIMPSHYTGTKETISLTNLTATSKAVKDFTDKRNKKAGKLREDTMSALKIIHDYKAAGSKQGWLNKHFGVVGRHPVVTQSTFESFLKNIGWFKNTEYMTLKEFDELVGKNTVPKEFKDSKIMIAVKYHDDNETLVSIIDMEDDVLLDKGENMFDKLGRNSLSAMSMRNIRLKKNKEDRSGLKLSLLSNMLMVSNPKVKVIEAGTANMYAQTKNPDKISTKNYYSTNLLHYNNQLYNLGNMDSFMSLLSPSMRKWFKNKNIVTPHFNFKTYLHNLYTTEGITGKGTIANQMKRVDQLSKRDEGAFYMGRLRQLIDKYIDDGMPNDSNFFEELNIIRSAMHQISLADVYRNEINTYEKFNATDLMIYGAQNIGEENNRIVQEHIIRAEKKINSQVVALKKQEHEAIEEWRKATNASKGLLRGYSLLDTSKKRYDRIYDKKTVNGKTYRTGGIYWTNKITSDMSPVEKELAKRALENNLTDEELAAGKKIVDYIENLMIRNVMTYEDSYGRNYAFSKKTDLNLSKEELEEVRRKRAKELLYKNSSYYRGFMPIMTKTADERLAQFNLKKSYSTALRNASDIEALFEDSPYDLTQEDDKLITTLTDRLFSQIGYGSYNPTSKSSEYGSGNRTDMLGIKLIKTANDKVQWELVDPERNNNLSYNIENILDYFTEATVRTPIIENEVLPIINGTLLWLRNVGENRNEKQAKSIEEHIKAVRDFQILNKRKQIGGKFLWMDRDKIFGFISTITTPAVMTGSVTVPLVSATSNIATTFSYGLASRLAKTAMFTDKDVVSAAGKVWGKDRKLVKEMAIEYAVTNSTEYEMVHLSTLKLYDKKLISNYMVNYPNRLTDIETRLIIMVAQMIKDGSYNAHSLDENGKMVYDASKDERWKGKGGQEMRRAMQDRMEQQGLSLDDRGYDYSTANTFKALADMFGPGEFDKNTSNKMASYAWGRAALMLNKWFMARWLNAFGTANTFRVQGEILTHKIDENGDEIAYFEKLSAEGYANTAWKFMIHTLTNLGSEDRVKYTDLESWQKANITRFGVIMGELFLSIVLQQLLSNIKVGDGDKKKPLDETMYMGTIFRGVDSMFVFGTMFDLMTKPFAGLQIMRNAFFGPYGDAQFSHARNLIPGIKAAKFTNDFTEFYTGNPLIPNL